MRGSHYCVGIVVGGLGAQLQSRRRGHKCTGPQTTLESDIACEVSSVALSVAVMQEGRAQLHRALDNTRRRGRALPKSRALLGLLEDLILAAQCEAELTSSHYMTHTHM